MITNLEMTGLLQSATIESDVTVEVVLESHAIRRKSVEAKRTRFARLKSDTAYC
jgi:tRNA pseudouridine-54 N-methylase